MENIVNLKAQDKGKSNRIYVNILFIAAALTVQSCCLLYTSDAADE